MQEKGSGEAQGGMSRQARDYETIVFEKLALAGEKGLTPSNLANDLHFDRPLIENALASMERRGMIQRGGLLGRRLHLSKKGREHAIQEGVIPRLRSGGGG